MMNIMIFYETKKTLERVCKHYYFIIRVRIPVMKITYIHHSGYLVETDQALLLFDFVEGTLPALTPEKDLFVFVSHRHEDHFSPKIFDLAATHPRIRFILSDDIWQNKVPDHLHGLAWFMDPGKVLEWKEGGGLRVTTFKSTDEGVAFMAETGGYTIYHAGDLNNWRWNGEDLAWNNNMSTNYRRELEKIKASGFHPDVAMIPLDGRQEDLFYLGLDDFMRTVGAEMVFPMHFWEDFSVIPALKKLDCSAEYRDRVADICKAGQRFCFPAFPDNRSGGETT